MIVVFIYIVYSAINLLLNAKKPEEMKTWVTNLLYILFGSALFFGAMRIFSSVLNLNALKTSEGLVNELTSEH